MIVSNPIARPNTQRPVQNAKPGKPLNDVLKGIGSLSDAEKLAAELLAALSDLTSERVKANAVIAKSNSRESELLKATHYTPLAGTATDAQVKKSRDAGRELVKVRQAAKEAEAEAEIEIINARARSLRLELEPLEQIISSEHDAIRSDIDFHNDAAKQKYLNSAEVAKAKSIMKAAAEMEGRYPDTYCSSIDWDLIPAASTGVTLKPHQLDRQELLRQVRGACT